MIVRIKSIHKSYQGRKVLEIDEIEFEAAKIYAILGPNGSAKSTLLRIIAGVETADQGEILFSGKGREMAYMPQQPYLFDMKVIDNVKLGIKHKENTDMAAMEALKQVGMDSFANARARGLSGGEQQRVALARTLVLQKSLVLLDEPAAAVDISAVKSIENYIKTAGSEGAAVIFTTHNPSQALRIADEIIFIHGGRLIEKGPSDEVIQFPKADETREFLKNWRI